LPNRRKVILALVDGLTPSMLEAAVGTPEAPALTLLAENSAYTRAISVFPSLTPVCVSSIVTGVQPDVHHIPHLVWYSREEQRLVEYGSSFKAIRRAGMGRSIVDAIFNLSGKHLAPGALTLFEQLEDAGLVTAAVNIPCYRGRTRHRTKLPGVVRTVLGPRRFFFYSLFESDVTGAPLAVFGRSAGSIHRRRAAHARVTIRLDSTALRCHHPLTSPPRPRPRVSEVRRGPRGLPQEGHARERAHRLRRQWDATGTRRRTQTPPRPGASRGPRPDRHARRL